MPEGCRTCGGIQLCPKGVAYNGVSNKASRCDHGHDFSDIHDALCPAGGNAGEGTQASRCDHTHDFSEIVDALCAESELHGSSPLAARCDHKHEPSDMTGGLTGTIDVVTDVTYVSPNLIKTTKTLTFVNGILTTVSVAATATITTAADCP